MNKDRVEEVLGKWGVKPVARARTRDADVFIGEGYGNAWLDYPEPSYRVVFLVARGEDRFDFAGDFYTDFEKATTQKARVECALHLAGQTIDANREAGFYG